MQTNGEWIVIPVSTPRGSLIYGVATWIVGSGAMHIAYYANRRTEAQRICQECEDDGLIVDVAFPQPTSKE